MDGSQKQEKKTHHRAQRSSDVHESHLSVAMGSLATEGRHISMRLYTCTACVHGDMYMCTYEFSYTSVRGLFVCFRWSFMVV